MTKVRVRIPRTIGRARRSICFWVTLVLISCGPSTHLKVPEAAAGKALNENYLDVEAGWRLRVVAPVLKGGAALTPLKVEEVGAGQMEAKAPPGFLGFETQYYAVTKFHRGVKLRFESGVLNKEGIQVEELRPLKDYFPQPAHGRNVRLVYLVRATKAEHDMAVLWAAPADQMDVRWRSLQDSPDGCGSAGDWCYWVPKGVAARAEKQDTAGNWVPAQ